MDEKIKGPTVGQAVQFFTEDSAKQVGFIGRGPYAAIVTALHGGTHVRLRILPPLPLEPREDDARHLTDADTPAHMGNRWWMVPPADA